MNNLRLTPQQYQQMTAKKQPRVKNAKRKLVNGIEFDSTREARRYQDLALMQTAGQIFELRRQVPYHICVNGFHICDWLADFVYREKGLYVVEDSKGWKTDIYKLKKKLVEAQFNIRIKET